MRKCGASPSPRNVGAFAVRPSGLCFARGGLVVWAVSSEPVSVPTSLFNGENTGISSISDCFRARWVEKYLKLQRARRKFPKKKNREIFWVNRENLRRIREPNHQFRIACRTCKTPYDQFVPTLSIVEKKPKPARMRVLLGTAASGLCAAFNGQPGSFPFWQYATISYLMSSSTSQLVDETTIAEGSAGAG